MQAWGSVIVPALSSQPTDFGTCALDLVPYRVSYSAPARFQAPTGQLENRLTNLIISRQETPHDGRGGPPGRAEP
jgi:hypothetical protein